MLFFGLAFVAAGLLGLFATRLGWNDEGGLMRRYDWLGLCRILEKPWLGGGVRRAMNTVSLMLILIGLLALLTPIP